MTMPRVAGSKSPQAVDGVMCDGYGHHAHVVTERVYRVQGSSGYLCWECLLLMGSETNRAELVFNRTRHFLRRSVIR
jgi:hypothetical protein